MAKPKSPEGQERPHKVKKGRERIVHLEIVARRLGGGAPPSPEAYARAIEQWRRLPGAVMYVPVEDLAKAPDSPMPDDVDASAPPGNPNSRHDRD